jgi:hypothetical protein
MPDDASSPSELARLRDLYLNLMRSAVKHTLYRPLDTVPVAPHVIEAFKGQLKIAAAQGDVFSLDPLGIREAGRDTDAVYAQTMTSLDRLDNVRTCLETLLAEEIPGDLIETGVWRGGMSMYMRAILRAYDVTDRQVVVADSFEGLPLPKPDQFPADADFDPAESGRFAAGVDVVRENFASYGLLDDQVEFVKGWFCDSLPALADRSWALVRLDGDLYESTWDALSNLYPQLSVGGFVIVDDYVVPACRAAVDDYRAEQGIDDPVVRIDWAGSYWRRSR